MMVTPVTGNLCARISNIFNYLQPFFCGPVVEIPPLKKPDRLIFALGFFGFKENRGDDVKKFVAIASAIAALGFANAASAADMPAKAPVYKAAPVAVYNWTGWYFGGNIGYGWESNSNPTV